MCAKISLGLNIGKGRESRSRGAADNPNGIWKRRNRMEFGRREGRKESTKDDPRRIWFFLPSQFANETHRRTVRRNRCEFERSFRRWKPRQYVSRSRVSRSV